MFSEILPNVMALVVVEFTVRLGYAIFAIATLGFLGFGVAPPSPDWAAQIYQYYTLIDPYWWMTLFPALAIASLVVAVNLVADGIREGTSDERRRDDAGARASPSSSSPTACAGSTGACSAASRSRSSAGASYGLVGESGCGKSTAALGIVRYLPRNGRSPAGASRSPAEDVLALGAEVRFATTTRESSRWSTRTPAPP